VNERSRLQRAILLELLNVEEGRECSCAQIADELQATEQEVRLAVQGLRADGLASGAGERLSASRAARRMDELGLIGI